MELMGVIYLVFGSTMAFAVFMAVAIIAGKDILIAFQRKFSKVGCDVYVANNTRTISHFFMTPKEGVFRIKNNPYITNPEKTMNLTEAEQKRVMESLLKRENRLKARIKEITKQKSELEVLHKASKDDKQKYYIMSQITHLEKIIRDLENRIRLKQENYFKDKKPAFFYIEGDPIPKDFYEYYSTLDSKMVDNLVSRSITQPPNAAADKEFKILKLIIIGAGIAAAAAAVMAFQNNSTIMEICRVVGAAGC